MNATSTRPDAAGTMMRRMVAEGSASPNAGGTHSRMTPKTARVGADEPAAPRAAGIARTAMAETAMAETIIAGTMTAEAIIARTTTAAAMKTLVDGCGGLSGGIAMT